MRSIDYSPGWFDIFTMSLPDLLALDLYSVCEEDLDPIALRLWSLAEFERVHNVHKAMLLRDRTNPAISYYNLFEKVIIRYMSFKSYEKALGFLNSYFAYDDRERFGCRNHFILRNMAICHFNLGQSKKAREIIKDLIAMSPKDYWTYYDLAFEFYRLGFSKDCIYYLNLGLRTARLWGEESWISIFESELASVS